MVDNSAPVQQWLLSKISQWQLGLPESFIPLLSLALLVLCALAVLVVTRYVLKYELARMIKRTRSDWDDLLYDNGVFRRLAHLSPAVFVFVGAPWFFPADAELLAGAQKFAQLYLIVVLALTINALLNSLHQAYNASELSSRAPITGFIQVGKLVIAIAAVLLLVSNLLDKSPWLILSGLGAITAVLLLVFRDAILGFVAGIQIAANRMVNHGDWVTMEKYGADGNVLAIGLTTVKVQNWDNTITTIPTYALISEPVKNWRGMQDSGGRRIKRAVYIDIHSVSFCDEERLERFAKIRFIRDYIEKKRQELAEFRQVNQIDDSDLVNARRLTNLGTFRAYLTAYLRQHPQLNQDMTLMVRQLPPTELGIPLEIYCFCKDKAWVNYEGIQADIFDHVLAMLPAFHLRAYQRVSDSGAHRG